MRKNATMFMRFFLLSLSAGVLLFSLLIISTGARARQIVETQEIEHARAIAERIDQYLDLYLQHQTNMLLLFGGLTDLDLTDQSRVQELLEAVAENNPQTVGRLYFVTTDGLVFASNRLVYDIVGHPELNSVVEEAAQAGEGVTRSEPYRSPQLVEQTVAFARKVRGPDGDPVGMIVSEIRLSHLTGVLENTIEGDYSSFVILTGAGNTVLADRTSDFLPYVPRTLPKEIEEEFATALYSLPAGVRETSVGEDRVLAIKTSRNRIGWDLVVLVKQAAIRERVKILYAGFARVGVVVLVLTIVGTLLLSRHFAGLIHRLAETMDRISEPQAAAIDHRISHRDDEIGTLYRSFEDLISRLSESMERQRRAERQKRRMELLVLRGQIKPHFLGNTLACIASLCRQKRSADAEQMLRSLILLLTNSVDTLDEFSTVERELECIKAFVTLQRMRYGDRFSLHVEAPVNVLSYPLPKLLLQPIVENSIFHGFIDRSHRYRIDVSIETTGTDLRIAISDDGTGMPDERLAWLRSYLSNPPHAEHDHEADVERYSVGLKNVSDRIRLNYGTDFGVFVDSSARGTTVTIRMPRVSAPRRETGPFV